MIWIILALLFSVTMTIVTLIRMYRYKAENERLHEAHGGCIIARDSFKVGLEACQNERDTLQLKLDEALRPKVPPSDGAAKKPRTKPTAKPPLNE